MRAGNRRKIRFQVLLSAHIGLIADLDMDERPRGVYRCKPITGETQDETADSARPPPPPLSVLTITAAAYDALGK